MLYLQTEVSSFFARLIDGTVNEADQVILILSAVAGIVLLFIAVQYIRQHWTKTGRLARGRAMTHRERQKYLNYVLGDGITEVVEELELAGKISREEARRYYMLLGNIFSNPDIIPRNRLVLKERIKQTLKHGGIAGPKQKIPGGHPADDLVVAAPFVKEETTVIPIRKGGFGASFLKKVAG